MSTLISPADFTVDNQLPNISLQGNDIQQYINQYEPEFLEKLLGADMYAEFIAGLPVGDVSISQGFAVVSGTNTKFLSFFEVGDTITINGETHMISVINSDIQLNTADNWNQTLNHSSYYGEKRWIDLLNLPNFKTAIVCYVYWFYQYASGVSITMTTGQGQSKKQNATTVSPYPKMVYSWNNMVKYNKATNKFLKDNSTIYPEYKPVNLPEWFCCFDGFSWFYPGFDSSWYWGFGCHELPDIYRIKNSLGV